MADPNIGGHIRTESVRPCVQCGEPTPWLEVNFEARICPGECTAAAWREWAHA